MGQSCLELFLGQDNQIFRLRSTKKQYSKILQTKELKNVRKDYTQIKPKRHPSASGTMIADIKLMNVESGSKIPNEVLV